MALSVAFAGSPALADGEATPPPARSSAELCANVPADFAPFVDIEDTVFDADIECLSFADITQGGPEGRPTNEYGPELSVRRDAMASFVANLLDTAEELDTGAQVQALPAFDGVVEFTDVLADNVHRQNIDRLTEAGVVRGKDATRYAPAERVTRAQMATFIVQALRFANGQDLSTAEDFFTDDAVAVPHEPNINAAAAAGIAIGDGRDSVTPLRDIRRDQMAGFLIRGLALLEAEGDIRPIGEQAPSEVVVEDSSLAPGEPLRFTVIVEDAEAQPAALADITTAATVASVTVSAPCVDTATFTSDADPVEDGFQVSIPIRSGAESGSCTVQVDIVDSEGNESSQSFTVTITAPANPPPSGGGGGGVGTAPVQGQATVVVNDDTLMLGESVTGTITGDGLTSATVSGACITSGDLQDGNDDPRDGIQFARPTTAPGDPCTLTFTSRFANGTTDEDRVDITVTYPSVPRDATVVIDDRDVAVGERITGSVTGEGLINVNISGFCIDNDSFSDDSASGTIPFSVLTRQASSPCQLTFISSFSNGTSDEEQQTVNVTPALDGGPRIIGARVTFDMEDSAMSTETGGGMADSSMATGTASNEDTFLLQTDEQLAFEVPRGVIVLEDADGDEFSVECNEETPSSTTTKAQCQVTGEDDSDLQVGLSEDPQGDGTGSEPGLQYPLRILDVSGLRDDEGEEFDVTNSPDKLIELPPAPRIVDARVATDMADALGATGTATSGDVFELDFDKPVSNAGGLLDLADEDGDRFRVSCTGSDDPWNGMTDAACEQDTADGSIVRIRLLENPTRTGDSGLGDGFQYPLTIEAVDGFIDTVGQDVDLANSDRTLQIDERTDSPPPPPRMPSPEFSMCVVMPMFCMPGGFFLG